MDSATLQEIRTAPLFAGLDDAQLGCIEPGEIINVPAGTVLVSEGERARISSWSSKATVRVVRTYDRQTS